MSTTPVDVVVEMMIGDTWVDVTDDVRLASADSGGGITIERGRANEGSEVEPTSINLTLNNAGGVYSPRNPSGPYWGMLKRNLPIRVGVRRLIDTFSRTLSNQWGSCDSGVAYQLTGTAANFDIASGAGTIQAATGHQMATLVSQYRDVDVQVRIKVSNRTSEFGVLVRTDPAVLSWLSFYITPGTPDLWRFGQVVTASGVAVAYNNTADFQVVAGTWYRFHAQARGDRFRFRIWEDGDIEPGWKAWIVASPAKEPTRWPAATGQVGVFAKDGTALVSYDDLVITNYRAYGEITKLPVRYDLSRADRWVPIEAKGITRRMGQGASEQSAITHHLEQYESTYGWWTLESGDKNDTLLPANNEGGLPAVYQGLDFQEDPNLPGSAGVAFIGDSLGRISCQIQQNPINGHRPVTGQEAFVWAFRLPAAPTGDSTPFTLTSTGTATTWQIQINAGSAVTVYARSHDGTLLSSAAALLYFPAGGGGTAVNPGDWLFCCLQLTQNGGNVDWTWTFHTPLGGVDFWILSGSYAGTTGLLRSFTASGTVATEPVGGLYLAQFFHYPAQFPFVSYAFADAARAFGGEDSTTRYLRVLADKGIDRTMIGNTGHGQPMGYQLADTLLGILQDCAEVDDGFLVEGRDDKALDLRTNEMAYLSVPMVLDVDAGHLTAPLEPNPDDQQTRNDVTVTRPQGGSARSVQLSGPMNVGDPNGTDPDAIGVYAESVERNLGSTAQLLPTANWRRSRGTQVEERYSQLTVDLTSSAYQNSAALAAQVADLDMGDLVWVRNLEVSPDDSRQIIQHVVEKLDQYDWDFTFVTTPARIYNVGFLGRTTRAGTVNSFTTADFHAGTDTALTVQRADANLGLWVLPGTEPASFPFDIMVGGVRLHVTSISGSSDPQTMTVSATPVNGQVKTIPAGSQVLLYEPWTLAW